MGKFHELSAKVLSDPVLFEKPLKKCVDSLERALKTDGGLYSKTTSGLRNKRKYNVASIKTSGPSKFRRVYKTSGSGAAGNGAKRKGSFYEKKGVPEESSMVIPRKKKRTKAPHNLAWNVSKNQPNATTHHPRMK